MFLLLLSALSAQAALSRAQSGPSLDLGLGLGLRGAPLGANLGAVASAGWWAGKYDDDYAFGRYWLLGATARADWRPGAFGLTPMLEIRRGLELLVASVAPFVAGGPTLSLGDPSTVGVAGRLGAIVRLRRTRTVGVTLRLEAGADYFQRVSFAGGALVGVSYARPAHALSDLGPSE